MPVRRSDRITRGESGRIGSSITRAPTTVPSTATNTHEEPSRLVRRRMSLARCGRGAPSRHEAPLAQRHVMRAHAPLDPRPVLLLRIVGELQREVALPRGANDRGGQHVRRHLVDRGREPQHLVAVERPEHLDVGDLRDARGQRAGLVEQQHLAACDRLQRAATFDDDPAARRAGDAGHHRDRHRQDQRTRRGHHEHREGTGGIPAEQPGAARDHQRDRDEDRGVAVGQSDERRLVLFGFLHQTHDPGVGALLGRRRCPQVVGGTGVHGARPHEVAHRAFHRSRFAGERRFVEDAVAQHHAVDGHDLAGLDHEPVPHRHLFDRPGDEIVALVPIDGSRRPFQQGRQLAVRAPVRVGLQGLAGGQHQGDDGAGQVLLQRQAPPAWRAARSRRRPG